MKFLHLGWKMLQRNPWLNLLLVLQLGVALLVISLALSMVMGHLLPVIQSSALLAQNGVYYQYPDEARNFFGKENELHKQCDQTIEALPGLKAVYRVDQSSYSDPSAIAAEGQQTGGTVFIYPETMLLKDYNLPLEQGRWADLVPAEDGAIPVVIFHSLQEPYKIGQTYLLEFKNWDEPEKAVRIPIKIVGVLYREQGIPNFGVGGALTTMRSILDNPWYEQNPYPNFVTTDSAFSALAPYIYTSQTNRMVLFDATLSTAQTEENRSVLRANGYINTFGDLLTNSYDETMLSLQFFLPGILCGLIIAFFGVVSFTALNCQRSLYAFAVYALCGARWRDSLKISLAYVGYLCTGGLLLYATAHTVLLTAVEHVNFLPFTIYNVALVAVFLTLIVGTAIAIPAYTLRRTSLLEQIHTDET